MPLEEVQRAKECLKAVRGSTLPKGRHLKRADLARLFAACDRTPAGARDAAVLALLAVGLRRAEVAAVQLGDYEPETGRLVVKGKGSKERAVWLTNGAAEAVSDWLKVRGSAEGALLARFSKDGETAGFGLTNQAVYNILARLAADARVAVSPHDLRRTFAGEALDMGVDVVSLQSLMGHASPATTARYDRRGDEAKKRAMALLTVPYNRK
jgi:integrase